MKTALLAAALALPLAAAAAERLVVLNKADATLVTVDPATMQVLGRVPTGRGPHEAVASADGRFAYVANYGDQVPNNSLSIIDLEALKEVKRVDLGALVRPHGMQLHDGKVYFTSEGSRTVARYDPAADKVDWLAGTGQSATHMLVLKFTPDGQRAFISRAQAGEVAAFDLEKLEVVASVKTGQGPDGLAYALSR